MKAHVAAFFFGGILAVAVGWRVGQRTDEIPPGPLVGKILHQVEQNYVDADVDIDVVFRRGLDQMMRGLDRNTRYIGPDRVEKFDGETEGYFVGIGVVLTAPEDEYPSIQTVIDTGPAGEAGIQVGDQILQVAGEDVHGLPMRDLKRKIQGPEGTRVALRLRRGDLEPLDLEVSRARVNVSSIGGLRIYEGETTLGYFRINQFQTGTARDTREAMSRLVAAGAEGVALDLRQNVGGILTEGVEVAELFLESGVILRTKGRESKGRKKKSRVYEVQTPGPFQTIPLIVLVDRGSASASEFVAAALQDHRRAVLVGDESYGKWTVQTIISLGTDTKDGLLKLTTSSFHRPDPERVHRDEEGRRRIRPDVLVPVDDDTSENLLLAWQADNLKNINSSLVVARHERPRFDDPPEDGAPRTVDSVLIRALAVLSKPAIHEKYLRGSLDADDASSGDADSAAGKKAAGRER